MTLLQLINRIRLVAMETSNLPEAIPTRMLDQDVLIEIILPRCMDVLAEKISRTSEGLEALRKQQAIVLSNGSGTFPSIIKEEHIGSMTIVEDLTASYVPSYMEFFQDDANLFCGTFTVRDGIFFYRARGDDIGQVNLTMNVIAICRPILPRNYRRYG